jgi:hypothetical protein
MLEFLRGKASARKLRLFAVACCRHIGQRLLLAEHRGAVEVAAGYADGLVAEGDLAEGHEQAEVGLLGLLSPRDGDAVAKAGLDRPTALSAAEAATGVSASGLELDRSASPWMSHYSVRQVADSARRATGTGGG